MNKKCCRCKNIKDSTEFYKDASRRDELYVQCRECVKIRNAEYYQKNQKDILKKQAIYDKENPEYIKKWQKENSEYLKKYQAKWREENSEKIKEYQAKWREENQEYGAKWREDNPDYINEYMKNRLAIDPVFKVLHSIRSRQSMFFSALKNKIINGKGIKKSAGFYEMLGCDEETFRIHMESQFRDGKTWENHGSYWQVDHIISLASFDMSDSKQQREALNYKNLQPLTIEENLRKGSK